MEGTAAVEVLVISEASRLLGDLVARSLKVRFPDLDLDGWRESATAEIFSACQDVAASCVFAQTGVMP